MRPARLRWLVTLASGLLFTGVAQAQTSAAGVTPVLLEGNPDCADFGYDLGFKTEDGAPWDGVYTLTSADGILTGIQAEDPDNTITILNSTEHTFDWASTLGLDAVIVKAGADSNTYFYELDPASPWYDSSYGEELFADQGLGTPDIQAISHLEFCYDYDLPGVVDPADASGTYQRLVDWTLDKSVDEPSHAGNIGDSFESSYTVTATKTVTVYGYEVSGDVTIYNDSPLDATVDIEVTLQSDLLPSILIAECSGQDVSIPAGGSEACSFIVALGDEDPGLVSITTDVFSKTLGIDGGVVVSPVLFEAQAAPGSDPDVVQVVDDHASSNPPLPVFTDESGSWNYTAQFPCAEDLAAYQGDGIAYYEVPNTARILDGEAVLEEDSELVDVTCYAPVVVKSAATSYTREYDWTITKSASPVAHEGFVGDSFESTWTVAVDQTITEKDFAVAGTITVDNPNPDDPMTLAVSDEVAGSPAILDCQGTLDVPAGGQATCDYTATLVSKADGVNVATVSLGAYDFEASASYAFGDPTNVAGPSFIDVDDARSPEGGWSADGDATFTYTEGFDCPTDGSLYGGGTVHADYDNTATILQTGDFDTASVTTDCHAPLVSKTADPAYKRTYTWSIDKSVEPEVHELLAGDSADSTWTVAVDRTTTDSDFAVSGVITVVNPHPGAEMSVTLADSLPDAVLDCGGSLAVPADSSATCGYSASLADKTDGINVATATLNGVDFEASAAYLFGEPTDVVGHGSIDVTDTHGMAWQADGDAQWSYEQTFECSSSPSDYEGGVLAFEDPNTATITQTAQSADAKVDVACYAPLVAKTAAASYTRAFAWEITKSVDPASHAGFIGGEGFSSTYTVAVDRTVTDSDFAVSGSIEIGNPGPVPMTLTLADTLPGSEVDLGACANGVDLGAYEATSCAYTASLAEPVDGTNTATVTMNQIGFEASAAYAFGDPTTTVGEETVDVTDTNGQAWSAQDSASWTYPGTFECSSVLADYSVGIWQDAFPNTATIVETGDSADALVTLDCYAPVAAKTAGTDYTLAYTWEIDKDVAPASHTGFLGDSFSSDYTVDVVRTDTESAFLVSGEILVANPHPGASMTVDIADSVGGTPADLDCGSTLVVPAGQTAACAYSATLVEKADGLNQATVALNGIPQTAEAPWAFGAPTTVDGYAEVQVDDTNGESWSAAGSDGWAYARSFDCPTDTGAYTGGVYDETVPNTATISETGQADDASVDLTCYVPAKATVVKTTEEGPADIGQGSFEFQLYDPSGALVETRTLDGAGNVAFATDLLIGGTWEIVEILPVGWVADDPTCTFEVAYPAAAGAQFECAFTNTEMGRVTVLKLTNGIADETQAWTFALYEGSDGFGGAELASATTPPVDLDFGVDLDPAGTYTVCELAVPAGWSSEWMVDTTGDGFADTIVPPYNPDADEDPPEDLGNRCFDFGAGTAYPVPVGDVLAFEVDNVMPGGSPRTPGYWKNWNTCTNGGQADNAVRNGGWQEGYWLLDDVLADPGITWDDNLADDFVFQILTCEEGVAILDHRDLHRGKKHASDAAYNLARNLLAYQLNQAAGACVPVGAVLGDQTIEELAIEAEWLLDALDFDAGGATFLRSRDDDYQRANELATALDDYNNGSFCGDGE